MILVTMYTSRVGTKRKQFYVVLTMIKRTNLFHHFTDTAACFGAKIFTWVRFET